MMPTVRKLTPDEVQRIENKGPGQRKLTEAQYDRFLSEYAVGEYGEAELNEDEKRLTVHRRLQAAATRHRLGIHFLRTTGNIIRFQVISGDGQVAEQPPAQEQIPEQEPEPVAADTPPAKRRPGRPKKQAV
jgi:hypothetical protein